MSDHLQTKEQLTRFLKEGDAGDPLQWLEHAKATAFLTALDDRTIFECIVAALPVALRPHLDVQEEWRSEANYDALLTHLKDALFARRAVTLFSSPQRNSQTPEQFLSEFSDRFDEMQAETRSPEEFLPFMAVAGLKDAELKRELFAFLAKTPGATLFDVRDRLVQLNPEVDKENY